MVQLHFIHGCYQSIIQCLRTFFLRPGFTEQIELWRRRTNELGKLSDVYDGKVWNEFLNIRGRPFLSLPYNLALSLNIDWFQPIPHTLSIWPFKTCLEVQGTPMTTSFLLVLYLGRRNQSSIQTRIYVL